MKVAVKSLVFSFSYNDLPLHLKSCFLHCSLFPKDNKVDREMLITLWVAEGFIEEGPGKAMEDIADEYFKELLDRSMLLGNADGCQVHDVVR
ncbi:hypothetical protein AMTRI_Chr10g6580 [Amborella trichopoda]